MALIEGTSSSSESSIPGHSPSGGGRWADDAVLKVPTDGAGMVVPEASQSLPVRVNAGGGRRWLSAIPVQEVDRDQRVALTGLVREARGSRPAIP